MEQDNLSSNPSSATFWLSIATQKSTLNVIAVNNSLFAYNFQQGDYLVLAGVGWSHSDTLCSSMWHLFPHIGSLGFLTVWWSQGMNQLTSKSLWASFKGYLKPASTSSTLA
jgi:hypothetical protein